VERRLAEFSTMDEAIEKFMLLTGYYGQQVEMDKQGRLLIPQQLRAKAGLEKDTEVDVVGTATYLEVHNRAAHEAAVTACELTAENKAFLAPILRNLN
jgi:MraZ protein